MTSSSRGTWRAFIGFTRFAGGGRTERSVHAIIASRRPREDAVTLRPVREERREDSHRRGEVKWLETQGEREREKVRVLGW